jgi:hypothetical protein
MGTTGFGVAAVLFVLSLRQEHDFAKLLARL